MLDRFLRMAVVMVLAYAPAGWAQGLAPAADPYRVTDVFVTATGGDLGAMRERAFEQGLRIAVQRLFDQIGAGAMSAALDPTDLSGILQGVQVTDEQAGPERYSARLTYQFRPAQVDALLGRAAPGPGPAAAMPMAVAPDSGVAAVAPALAGPEPTDGPVLVLPVLRARGGPVLWDGADPNPWLAAWQTGGDPGGDILLPLGDLADIRDIDAERALAGDRAALETIGRRYGAETVVVAPAEFQGDGLAIALDRYGPGGAAGSDVVTVPGAGAGGADAVFDAAVAAVTARLGGAAAPAIATAPIAVTPAVAVPAAPTASLPPAVGVPPAGGQIAAPLPTGRADGGMTVIVPIRDVDDWFDMQDRLARIAGVGGPRILSLSTERALVEMPFVGDREQLQALLGRHGLGLQQGPLGPELHRLDARR